MPNEGNMILTSNKNSLLFFLQQKESVFKETNYLQLYNNTHEVFKIMKKHCWGLFDVTNKSSELTFQLLHHVALENSHRDVPVKKNITFHLFYILKILLFNIY